MGQDEVLRYLENKNDWVTIKELQEAINVNRNAVSAAVRRLMKTDFIVVKLVKEGRTKKYHIKINNGQDNINNYSEKESDIIVSG